MTPEQIEHMVTRFLRWELPETFNPDGGIKYTPSLFNRSPYNHRPVGTNLLDYTQAKEMVEHMLEGLPE